MSDPDIAPEDEELMEESMDQGELYVSHSTYDGKGGQSRRESDRRRRKERADYAPDGSPTFEPPILEHKHPPLEDDLVDIGEQDLGAEVADDYLSRSTYPFEPTSPREPTIVRHRRGTIDDIAPEDKSLLADSEQTGKIYDSQSTHEVGEPGAVLLEKATRLREKSVETLTETSIVEHKHPSPEIDAVDDSGRSVEDQTGGIYVPRSTYETGKPIEGLGEYLTGVGLAGGVAFLRGAKSVVDPVEWARGAHDLTYLASSPEARRRLTEHISRDPFSFAVDIGASVAGGYYGGRFISGLYRGAKRAELQDFYDEFPEEAFYAEDGIPDPKIPHPIDVERVAVKSIDEVRVVDDLGAGFLDDHRIARGSWPKSGTKGFGYRRTGADLVPELLPEGMGYTEIHTRFWLEYGQTHLPGVTRVPPYFDSALGLSPLSGVAPALGAGSGLLSGVPSLDDPLPKSKVDVKIDTKINFFDETGLDDVTRIIEIADIDDPLKPPIPHVPPISKPKIVQPTLPLFEPYPPIEETIIEEDTDVASVLLNLPEQIIEQKTETIMDFPVVFSPRLLDVPTSILDPPLPRGRRRRRREVGIIDPLMGFEKREYQVADPIDMILGVGSKKKSSKKRRKTKKKTRRNRR